MAIDPGALATENATVVARLEDAGAIVLGKVKLTEGAFSDHHAEVEPPRNPWNGAHWPGVSSSGSGVATAAGLCFAALGTGHGRLDPLPVRGERPDRDQTNLGSGQPARDGRARTQSGPCRSDRTDSARCRRSARGHRGGPIRGIQRRCWTTPQTMSRLVRMASQDCGSVSTGHGTRRASTRNSLRPDRISKTQCGRRELKSSRSRCLILVQS